MEFFARHISRYLRPFWYEFEKYVYRLEKTNSNIRVLKNIHAGYPLLVVGNGPSLNKTPLDQFASTPSIGMNKINLIFPKTHWRPDYIISINRHVIKQQEDFFSVSDIPIYLSWQGRYPLKRESREKVNFFLNLPYINFSDDITKGLGIGGTVTYTALQFAYYMGANPVVLVGIDHNFHTKGAANKLVKASGWDLNHFDKNYFSGGAEWNLPDLELSERAYQIARNKYEVAGREIYDATVDGKLDIFKKIDIPEALSICERKS